MRRGGGLNRGDEHHTRTLPHESSDERRRRRGRGREKRGRGLPARRRDQTWLARNCVEASSAHFSRF